MFIYLIFIFYKLFINELVYYRCNENGNPLDTYILDLQLAQIASLTTDLNCFLYPNLDINSRETELKSLLKIYFNTYTSIVCKTKLTLPFTLQELENDFKNKELYGFIIGITVLSILHVDPDDSIEIDFLGKEKNTEKQSEDVGNNLIRLASIEGEIQTKFLSLVNAMVASSDRWIDSL